MSVEMKFENIDELIKEFETLATEDEMDRIDKKILEECAELAHKQVVRNIWYSKDHNKSGPQHYDTKRSTPPGHAKENVPISKVKKKRGIQTIMVGFPKGDNEPWFYAKFREWGTSKMPPVHVFGGTNRKLFKKYEELAIKYYRKELEKRLNKR